MIAPVSTLPSRAGSEQSAARGSPIRCDLLTGQTCRLA